MLFDNANSLYANIALLRQRDPNDRIDAISSIFHDYHDPEVNRLFASSPPAPDEMVSYNFSRDNKKKVIMLVTCLILLITIRVMKDVSKLSQKEEEEIEGLDLVCIFACKITWCY